jgi:hypothetical protein
MEHMTFADHVRAIMKEHGVPENKAQMMAWLEGPRSIAQVKEQTK